MRAIAVNIEKKSGRRKGATMKKSRPDKQKEKYEVVVCSIASVVPEGPLVGRKA